METKDFGWAIRKLKSGRLVTRAGWNGKGMYLFLQMPNSNDAVAPTLPYIMMVTAEVDLVPWLASQTDVLAEDWDLEGSDIDNRLVTEVRFG